jgi:galactokinase
VPPERTRAFAPGRVNLIGEHTDYNEGLALPFAITEGVTVQAEATTPVAGAERRVQAHAVDLGEHDEFSVESPPPATGWRAFVRGAVAELERAGFPLVPARLQITGDVPYGTGLSSSAALEVALCLALLDLGDYPGTGGREIDRMSLARLCARVESEWVGAKTGLLDQLASLYGERDTALCIDFRTLEIETVAVRLQDWRLVVVDSGERRSLASSGYNERREECARACELLGVTSLRDADPGSVLDLPEPLRRRATHVLGENQRVREAVEALRAGDIAALGPLLTASHASLRDCYEVSTAGLEATVSGILAAGAAGARLIGGGFGGSVLALLAPGIPPPPGAREVQPGAGAHLLEP